ncbi:dTDP-4-dehydrorhamnose 3,5-epimerase family protein [Magnetovibrio sp.]|uniref:dTDP-4-dehydrorhamnose 3,5-epimerase family protein n=1 Tax=Magnetovibrio sp. TaxID=2024836 RepID=UPI002F9524FA
MNTIAATSKPGTVVEGLEVRHHDFPDILTFRSPVRSDIRGSVAPTYNKEFFDSLGIKFDVLHENHCVSPHTATVRGFHYQLPPHSQAKLIRVVRGRMLDVNVDVRKSSPTFGQHIAIELVAGEWDQIFVPGHYAHCYCTLEENTDVVFKLGAGFAPEHAVGLAWNDPALGIDWPISQDEAIVLERDLDRPSFHDVTALHP